MRDVVHAEFGRRERLGGRVGYLVDGDHPRPVQVRVAGQELLDRIPRDGGGEQDAGLRIAQRRVQPLGMPGQFRGEQRDRDGARLDRRVEPGDVVDALRRQHRNALTATGHLLDARADGFQPDTELAPGHLVRGAVVRTAVVEVAIRDGVPHVGDVAVDERNQVDAGRQCDPAVGVQAVLDPQQAGHTIVAPKGVIHTVQSRHAMRPAGVGDVRANRKSDGRIRSFRR